MSIKDIAANEARRSGGAGRSKLLSTASMSETRSSLRARGRTVGLCHGCFDILHSGHVHYLTQAARLCDVLVVSITSAPHVNKGPGRPVFDDEARAAVLSALSVVDHVVINDHATAVPVLEALRPDFYFKGADYVANDDPRLREEVELLDKHGGEFVLTDGTVLDSSSRAARVLQGTR
jgi:rfaE bifunctional protein nucleotidyltransferase chain/domain